MNADKWLKVTKEGLYCEPGNFFIDPMWPVNNAVVTHGHADHARSGHHNLYATPPTGAIMKTRYGDTCANHFNFYDYGQSFVIGDVKLRFEPAGHILGSAQAVMEYDGEIVVASGDYKRTPDVTCVPFKAVKCDVFITEATFALPVFKHPKLEDEIAKLMSSLQLFPHRCHVIGSYALGKCQRVIMGLRNAGYVKPIYLHGAMIKLCDLYKEFGIPLGELKLVSDVDKAELAGEIVICPPSAVADRWSRKLPDALACMASGWMQIRARAKQKLVELPLVISDHSDWYELLDTVDEIKPREVWVTHGREETLIYALEQKGIKARALKLIGYEDEETD